MEVVKMKKRAVIVALVFVLITQLSFFVHASSELLANGGAESGGDVPDGWGNWSTVDEVPFSWDSSTAHDGSKSIKIYNDEARPSTWNQQLRGLDVNKEYVLSGWIKTQGVVMPGESGAGLAVEMKDASNNILKEAATVPLSDDNDWTYMEVKFSPVEGYDHLVIGARLWGASGTAWFDDVSVKEAGKEAAQQINPPAEKDNAANNTSNPKTGDFSVIPYILAASGSSVLVFRKK